jgi:HlyD family secretion protein
VSLDAFPNQSFAGTIRRVAAYVLELEKQARTVEVEVDLVAPGDAPSLLPGYSADVEVILAVRENALRVPTEAVLEGNRVLVYRSDPDGETGRLEERTLIPGLSSWQFTEVVSGVVAGDQVVVSVDRQGVAPGALAVPERAPTGAAIP